MVDAFLKSAVFITDVEQACNYVEVEYTKYVVGENRYETFVDYFNTTPAGDWVEITSLKQNILLEKFLDTMLVKNTEVLQKMCELVLDKAQCSTRLMYTSKILAPSFIPQSWTFVSAGSAHSWMIFAWKCFPKSCTTAMTIGDSKSFLTSYN